MNADPTLHHPAGDEEIRACFPVMRELRPNLASADEFAVRVARQQRTGYKLLAAWRDGRPVALAGYRLQENLLHGLHLYVDDLVAAAPEQSQGLGVRLLDALANEGRAEGCGKLVLGAALANALAHRFYYRYGMLALGLGFSKSLGAGSLGASPKDLLLPTNTGFPLAALPRRE